MIHILSAKKKNLTIISSLMVIVRSYKSTYKFILMFTVIQHIVVIFQGQANVS